MRNDVYFCSPKIKIEGVNNIELSEAVKLLSSEPILELDTENSSLDCHYAMPILLSLGVKSKKVVVDTLNFPPEIVKDFLDNFSDKLLLLANAKYDYKILKVNFNYTLNNFYDVIVAEQTIRMGLSLQVRDKIVKGNSLDNLIERYCDSAPSFEKSTRDEFINANKKFNITYKHVIYSAEDVQFLNEIRTKQLETLEKQKQIWWVTEVEFPLTKVIAEAEIEGIPFNTEKWRGIIRENKINHKKYEVDMDNLLKEYLKDNHTFLGGKYFRERKKESLIQTSMFDVPEKVIENKNKGNINYGSNAQIKELFRDLEVDIPLIKDPKTGMYKESTGIPSLENLLAVNPDIKIRSFIEKFIQYQKLGKEISSFGQNYIDAVNTVTDNIHTSYRQSSADTGRFQSGGGKQEKDKINSQQIPGKSKFRTCFGGDPNYYYMTLDLTGAELVILASLSGDKYLASILDDPHSPLATASYSKIISYILTNMCHKNYPWEKGREISPSEKKANKRAFNELEELLGTKERALQAYTDGYFTITKKNAKDLRNSFKAVIYGIAYGATSDKVAETLRLPSKYGELIMQAMKGKIPKVFEYLDRASLLGLKQGYITLSERSNSRRWFYDVAKSLAHGGTVNKRIKSEVERACKNSPIQGTQACMVKEASVKLDEYFREEKEDSKILLWVHDEWVIRIKRSEITEYPSTFLPDKIKFDKISNIIKETCNKYLEGLEMGNDYTIASTWVK